MRKIYLLLVLALTVTSFGFGQAFTGTYNFATGGNDVTSFAYNGTAIPNMTISNITKVGVTSSSSTGNFRASDWPLGSTDGGAAGGTVSTTKYFQFTITANAGFTISNPTIDFGVGRSGTGPRRFQWRSSLDGYVSLIPVTTANAGVTSAGNVIQTPDAATGYLGNTVSLATTGQTTITFRVYSYGAEAIGGTGGLQGNLTFNGTLVCTPPTTQATGYNTTGITTSTGTLNWTRGNGTAGVLVVMREAATAAVDPTSGNNTYVPSATYGSGGSTTGPGNFVVFKGTGTTATVTGLTQNTAYSVAVYEYNTAGTCYNTTELTGNFTTLCTAVSSLPFTENFEGGVVPPACWTSFRGVNNVGVNEDWKISAAGEGRVGTLAARVNNENLASGTSQDWLVTPALDLSVTSSNQLTFYAKDFFNNITPPNPASTSSYTVRVSTSSQTNIASFATIATYTDIDFGNGSSSYQFKSVDLSTYDGQSQVYIAFVMAQSGFDGDVFFLDDVSVTGGCTPPSTQASAFNATSIDGGAGTATLNWTQNNGNNVLVVARAGSAVTTDPTSGTSYSANTAFGSGDQIGAGNFVIYDGPASTVNISNLLTNTTYHVAIYEYNTTATCYNLTQLTGNFFVPCASITLPYTEGFEGGTIPTCWAVFDNGLGAIQSWMVDGTVPNSGSFSAHLSYEDGSSGTSQDWLVTPPIDLTSVPNSDLTFFTMDSGDTFVYGSTYTIRVSTLSQTTPGDFVTIATYDESQLGSVYNQKTINLVAYSGQTVYIAFVMEQDLSSGGDDWYLDDIAVNEVVVPPVDYIYNNGWTPGDPSGVSTASDNIQVIAGTTSLTSPTVANNLTIDVGTTLNINSDASLTASGAVTNNGTLTLNSISNQYSSLIAGSTSGSGTFNYNRYVNGPAVAGSGGNDLISPPFSGQAFDQFKDANPNIRSNVDNSLYLFGPFEKTNGTYVTYAATETAPLAAGVGYRAASIGGGTFTFTGVMNTGNINSPIVIAGTQYDIWNLIGNPYPSYIKLADFLTANSANFNASQGGVYGYNGTSGSGGFEIWNDAYSLLNPNAVITPGQGFLVASGAPSVDVNFTSGMRITGTTDDFIPNRMSDQPIAYLQIKANISSKDYTTDFYFTDFASRGLNPGFDSGVFGNGAGATGIFSELVQENTGIDMGIQSIAYTDLGTDVSIPLGINVAQGQQVTVSMVNAILPDGINVFLEDNLTNVFTLLNANDYVFTPSSNLNNVGRFFLRFEDNALSAGISELDRLQIYAIDQTLHVNGLLNDATNVSLYDIQGRKVLSYGLESGSTNNTIDVSNVSTGVYVVKLSNVTQQKTQRVIIK